MPDTRVLVDVRVIQHSQGIPLVETAETDLVLREFIWCAEQILKQSARITNQLYHVPNRKQQLVGELCMYDFNIILVGPVRDRAVQHSVCELGLLCIGHAIVDRNDRGRRHQFLQACNFRCEHIVEPWSKPILSGNLEAMHLLLDSSGGHVCCNPNILTVLFAHPNVDQCPCVRLSRE